MLHLRNPKWQIVVHKIKCNLAEDRCILVTTVDDDTELVLCQFPFDDVRSVMYRVRLDRYPMHIEAGSLVGAYFIKNVLYTINMHTGLVAEYMSCPPGFHVDKLCLPRDDFIICVQNNVLRTFNPRGVRNSPNTNIGLIRPNDEEWTKSGIANVQFNREMFMLVLSRTGILHISRLTVDGTYSTKLFTIEDVSASAICSHCYAYQIDSHIIVHTLGNQERNRYPLAASSPLRELHVSSHGIAYVDADTKTHVVTASGHYELEADIHSLIFTNNIVAGICAKLLCMYVYNISWPSESRANHLNLTRKRPR